MNMQESLYAENHKLKSQIKALRDWSSKERLKESDPQYSSDRMRGYLEGVQHFQYKINEILGKE